MSSEILYRGEVTGLTYHLYSRHIDGLVPGVKLQLIPVENQYDPRAVGVFYNGDQIGWIPKAKNAPVWAALQELKSVSATVLNHDKSQGFNSRLYIGASEPVKGSASRHQAPITPVTQESNMSKLNALIEINKTSAASAAYMEAGHIANKQLGKVMSKQLPMMVRGYADTPLGHLIMANLAVLAIDHFRPDQRQLRRLAQAMQVQAYQELLQELDIDGMIDDLLDNGGIKRALAKLKDDPEASEE